MTTPDKQEPKRLIQIAEMLHATIPSTADSLKTLHERGAEAFEQPSEALEYATNLIRTQAEQGADYIDVNVDALGGGAAETMRRCVRLVAAHGRGVPPCVDSSSIDVLEAGLRAWFETGAEAAPLVNSITYADLDETTPILKMRRQDAFSVVCMLVGAEGPLKSPDEMVEAARTMFNAMREAGFAAEEIFFDVVCLGMGADGCVDAMGMPKPSHTRNAFQAIERITQDAAMAGCHAVLGVSNWGYGARKRRLGHIRAYVEVAIRHGMDAAIVDVAKGFGAKPAAPELVGLVEMFASLNGGEDSMTDYAMKMAEARASEWL